MTLHDLKLYDMTLLIEMQNEKGSEKPPKFRKWHLTTTSIELVCLANRATSILNCSSFCRNGVANSCRYQIEPVSRFKLHVRVHIHTFETVCALMRAHAQK